MNHNTRKWKRIYRIGKKKLSNEKGETLLEVVTSIGMFGLMVLMLASMFAMADTVSQRNYKTEQEVDAAVTKIVTEEGITDTDKQNVTVRFRIEDGMNVEFVDETVEQIQCKGLYKYR